VVGVIFFLLIFCVVKEIFFEVNDGEGGLSDPHLIYIKPQMLARAGGWQGT
jgi:hypothetical protein